LKAYATVTFDNAFVVRNIKVIEWQKGLFVAMPSRKLKESCPKCNFKNVVRSKFCNNCGASLPMTERKPVQVDDIGQRESEHRDIAHPITLECREYLQKKVLEGYEAEKQKGGSAPVEKAPNATVFAPVEKAPNETASAPVEKAPNETVPVYKKEETKKSLEGDLEF